MRRAAIPQGGILLDDPIGSQLLFQLLLILINAFFASTETAVVSLNENRVRKQAEDGDKKAALMLRMIESPTRFLSTIQVCITLSGFLASAFAADSFASVLSGALTAIGFTLLSPAVLHTVCVVLITLILSYFMSRRRLIPWLAFCLYCLGVLMLHGVKVRDARLLLPQLPAIADLCLELLARVKATRVDAVTGLATENVLYGSMEDEAARVREIFADPSRGDGQSSPLHRLCMGLVLLHFSNGREIVGRMGFRFADELMRRAAEALQEELPSDVVAARVGRFGMALLLPSVSGRSHIFRHT